MTSTRILARRRLSTTGAAPHNNAPPRRRRRTRGFVQVAASVATERLRLNVFGHAYVFVGALVIVVLFYLAIAAQITQSSYDIARLQDQQRQLIAEQDQLRYQDLLWLAPEFGSKGFAGLGKPIAMRYDTVVTETAADHAILSTGVYADLNGIVGNRTYPDGIPRESVEDPACPVWGAPNLGRSAAMLRVPTVGDALKLYSNGAGRVVSVAAKDRSALFTAGTSGDFAIWFELETGERILAWTTMPWTLVPNVALVVGPAAAFVTGQVIRINGGVVR